MRTVRSSGRVSGGCRAGCHGGSRAWRNQGVYLVPGGRYTSSQGGLDSHWSPEGGVPSPRGVPGSWGGLFLVPVRWNGGCITWSWGGAPGLGDGTCFQGGVSSPGGCTWSQGGVPWSGGVPGPGGVVLVPGGVCSRGVYLAQGGVPPSSGGCTWSGTPPCGQTDACKNITFATSLRTVIIPDYTWFGLYSYAIVSYCPIRFSSFMVYLNLRKYSANVPIDGILFWGNLRIKF